MTSLWYLSLYLGGLAAFAVCLGVVGYVVGGRE